MDIISLLILFSLLCQFNIVLKTGDLGNAPTKKLDFKDICSSIKPFDNFVWSKKKQVITYGPIQQSESKFLEIIENHVKKRNYEPSDENFLTQPSIDELAKTNIERISEFFGKFGFLIIEDFVNLRYSEKYLKQFISSLLIVFGVLWVKLKKKKDKINDQEYNILSKKMEDYLQFILDVKIEEIRKFENDEQRYSTFMQIFLNGIDVIKSLGKFKNTIESDVFSNQLLPLVPDDEFSYTIQNKELLKLSENVYKSVFINFDKIFGLPLFSNENIFNNFTELSLNASEFQGPSIDLLRTEISQYKNYNNINVRNEEKMAKKHFETFSEIVLENVNMTAKQLLDKQVDYKFEQGQKEIPSCANDPSMFKEKIKPMNKWPFIKLEENNPINVNDIVQFKFVDYYNKFLIYQKDPKIYEKNMKQNFDCPEKRYIPWTEHCRLIWYLNASRRQFYEKDNDPKDKIKQFKYSIRNKYKNLCLYLHNETLEYCCKHFDLSKPDYSYFMKAAYLDREKIEREDVSQMTKHQILDFYFFELLKKYPQEHADRINFYIEKVDAWRTGNGKTLLYFQDSCSEKDLNIIIQRMLPDDFYFYYLINILIGEDYKDEKLELLADNHLKFTLLNPFGPIKTTEEEIFMKKVEGIIQSNLNGIY